MAAWLLKTEPSTYSFSDLERDGTTRWDGISNFAALGYLREAKAGDTAVVYHTGSQKAAVEELYAKEKVTVVAVNVLTTKPKEKRRGTKRGRITGYTSSWRKAIVTLAPGQKIEFFEGV